MTTAFNPGGVGVRNGRFFGFPHSPLEAEVVILSVPWDVTTSYRDGAARGPMAMLDASYQLDFVSPIRERAWLSKIATLEIPSGWFEKSRELRMLAREVIRSLENGDDPAASRAPLERVNAESALFHDAVESEAAKWLAAGKRLVVAGGDHSVSFGPLRAHAARGSFSVLQIDAHADLRVAYEGFRHSHASVMREALELPAVDRLVQVGLRDLAPEELHAIRENKKIAAFFDWDLRRNQAKNESWAEQCKRIVEPLGEKVYLTVDIDGLDPKYCPHTGTPVPGGLELWEFHFLLEEVERSGRKFIGADLVEVAPAPTGDGWDANVGARVLFHLCQLLR